MKLKYICFATVVLMLAAPLAAHGQVGIEEKAKAAQAKPIDIRCPQNIQIGPVFVPDGWQSLGSLSKPRLQIKVDAKTQQVVCEYGNEASLFQTFFIAQNIPAGYECSIPYPKDYRAVCTKKTPGRRRER
jgi:hypothetical protein